MWVEFENAKDMQAYFAFHEQRYKNGDKCYMLAVTNPKAFEFLKGKGFTHCHEINPQEIT